MYKHNEKQFQNHEKSLLCTLENLSYSHDYFAFACLVAILHTLFFPLEGSYHMELSFNLKNIF